MAGIDDIFDETNSKAVAGWGKMYHGDPNFEKIVTVETPIKIRFTDEIDYNKLLYLLNKYRIDYKELNPSDN